jgi:hypothetical protein
VVFSQVLVLEDFQVVVFVLVLVLGDFLLVASLQLLEQQQNLSLELALYNLYHIRHFEIFPTSSFEYINSKLIITEISNFSKNLNYFLSYLY